MSRQRQSGVSRGDVDQVDHLVGHGEDRFAVGREAERTDAVVIPKSALLTSGGQTFVWRVEADGALVKQPVQTGLEAGGKIEVVTGLEERHAIIGLNPTAFREGQKVDVQP